MIDLIIAETNLLLTWFNPFSWLISRMIKENHEHLADRTVLSKGVNPAHYKAQLLNHSMGVELFRLGNQFNHSLTKKRFQMMKKIKSPKKGFIKYLALVPAIVISLGLFTAASAQQKTISSRVISEDGEPVPGASIVVFDIKDRITTGTVSDMEGRFTIKVDGNPDLIFSFVGFATIRMPADKAAKQDVVFYKEAFKMDLKDVKAADPKAKKLKVASEKTEFEADKISVRVTEGDETIDMEPVYVVDGKIVPEIESLNSDDIEEISVFKDPNSPEVKKYKAENGLIIVTMKKKSKKAKKVKKADQVKETEKEIFYIVEDIPSFPGGKEVLKGYIYKNLEYPEKAKKKGLSGEVYVQFVVNNKGVVKDIEVIKSSDKIFNEAAMDVFRDMPLWNPGKQRGKPVSAQVIVPVRFNAK